MDSQGVGANGKPKSRWFQVKLLIVRGVGPMTVVSVEGADQTIAEGVFTQLAEYVGERVLAVKERAVPQEGAVRRILSH
jgi:hypothetical protein